MFNSEFILPDKVSFPLLNWIIFHGATCTYIWGCPRLSVKGAGDADRKGSKAAHKTWAVVKVRDIVFKPKEKVLLRSESILWPNGDEGLFCF